MSEAAIQTEVKEEVVVKNPFDEKSWADQQPTIQEQAQDTAAQVQETTQAAEVQTSTQDTEEKTVDFNSFVKNEFGFETIDEAKEFFQTAKEKKEQPALKFENEDSEKFFNLLKEGKKDEVYEFLAQQKRIEKLSGAEVNAKTAEEIIKLSIQSKYPNLSEDEIDTVFQDKFSIPSKPIKSFEEDDEEYQQKLADWESKVSGIEKKMVIEAKMAQPEIAALKKNLVLPEIQSTQSSEPTQEDLQTVKELREQFEQTLESDYKNFGGFNVTFKDESSGIEIPIAYVPTDEEKVSLKNELSDFDHTEYFGNRWFAKDGKPQVPQMMADKYFLENKEKILQKVANEAANQMRLKMIEMQSNIKLNDKGQQQAFNPNANTNPLESLAAQVWATN